MIGGVVAGLILAALIGFWHYARGLDRLSDRVQAFKDSLDSIQEGLEDGNSAIANLRLLVVAAHPDRFTLPVQSAAKLQELSVSELEVVSETLHAFETEGALYTAISEMADPGSTALESSLSAHAVDVIEAHDLQASDLGSYWTAIRDKSGRELDDNSQ